MFDASYQEVRSREDPHSLGLWTSCLCKVIGFWKTSEFKKVQPLNYSHSKPPSQHSHALVLMLSTVSVSSPNQPNTPMSITQRYVEEKCATTTWRRGSTSEVVVQSSGCQSRITRSVTSSDPTSPSAKWRQSTENNGHHLGCVQSQLPLHHHAPWILNFNLLAVSGTCRNDNMSNSFLRRTWRV